MKTYLRTPASFLCLLLAIAAFLGSCFITASDGQGAVVFIFSGPLVLGLLFFAIKMASHLLRYISFTFLIFVLLFFAGVFFQPLRFLTEAPVKAVSAAFESLTGQTPYAWTRARNDIATMIRSELQRSEGKEIDFSKFKTALDWDYVCIFGPYTTSAAAQAILRVDDWQLETYSKTPTSDAATALVFLEDKKRRVAYVVDFPRNEADFAPAAGRCFARASAVFEHRTTDTGGVEFSARE